MSLGPLMLDVAGLALDEADREVLRHPLVGGVILFTRNYADRRQLAALCAEIHALRVPPLLIAVDHEGGRVQRFRSGFTELPPMAQLGDVYDRAPRAALALATELGWLMAAELRAIGVDFSFAPVLDLRSARSRVINDRAFHADPRAVGRLAQSFVRGMHQAGMAAVGKHFPGHGSVVADSHHELPVDRRPLGRLRHTDLVPFRLLCAAGIDGLMAAHIAFPRVDAVPVTYSRRWLAEILRGQLAFQGAIFTDDLSMAGAQIGTNPADRIAHALAAGCDMCLLCNDRPAALRALQELEIAPEPLSVVRLMRMHGRPALDEHALAAAPRRAAARDAIARIAAGSVSEPADGGAG